jgi:hypothetical protein
MCVLGQICRQGGKLLGLMRAAERLDRGGGIGLELVEMEY